jgi:hypothetical protein
MIACVLCETSSTLQNIILSFEVGTECHSRPLGVLCRINKLHYILHLDVLSHVAFESEIGFGRNHVLEIYAILISMFARLRSYLELDLVDELSSDM